MHATDRQTLAALLSHELLSRPAPPLVVDLSDEFDRDRALRTLRWLWQPGETATIAADPDLLRSALIWLSPDEYRYAFLRLLIAVLRDPTDAYADLVLTEAAATIRKGSVDLPGQFRTLSPSEIRLVCQAVSRLASDRADVEGLDDTTLRIHRRAVRNWRLFANVP